MVLVFWSEKNGFNGSHQPLVQRLDEVEENKGSPKRKFSKDQRNYVSSGNSSVSERANSYFVMLIALFSQWKSKYKI